MLPVPSCEEDRCGDEEEPDDDQDRGNRRGRSLDQKADHKTDERGADPQQNRVDAKTCSFHGENKSTPSLDAPQIEAGSHSLEEDFDLWSILRLGEPGIP